MNKELITGIAVGGLMHDLGKFAERSSMYPKGNPEIVKKKYRYDHPYHTARALSEIFKDAAERIVGDELFGESTLLDLAAKHHRPGRKIQTFIQITDWQAAGHERVRADLEAKRYETEGRSVKDQQPLISILSRINLTKPQDDQQRPDMFYKLQAPCLDHGENPEGMFPCSGEQYQAPEVRKAYEKYWRDFVEMLSPAGEMAAPLDLIDNFDTILEICRLYQWCMPETTRRQDLSDVSLFDHPKATAAIACGSLLYHADQAKDGGKVTKDMIKKTPDLQKFVLFCGDVSGIQRFVYQVSSKGAYKMLKGRSFFV